MPYFGNAKPLCVSLCEKPNFCCGNPKFIPLGYPFRCICAIAPSGFSSSAFDVQTSGTRRRPQDEGVARADLSKKVVYLRGPPEAVRLPYKCVEGTSLALLSLNPMQFNAFPHPQAGAMQLYIQVGRCQLKFLTNLLAGELQPFTHKK